MSESATGTEVVPYEDRALYIGYDPDLDFRKLALESKYFTRGFRLLGKDALIGVPHIVIGVTYREGFPREGKAGDYVSVEAVVADAKTLASNPIKHQLPVPPDQLSVYPNECVVYNDSGTGVRRYLTELFHNIGLVDVGPAKGDASPYDKPFQLWKSGADLATTGIVADNDGDAFRLPVMRGLRRSDYEWEGQPATTYYLG